MIGTRCRFCGAPLAHVFADLGMSPLSNSYLSHEQLGQPEAFYPLRALVCERCFLVQLEEFETAENLFSDYAYFSSYSTTWLKHAEAYAEAVIERFSLNEKTRVVEVASNDGYLLQYFVQHGIPVLGVEPAANVAAEAIAKGVPTVIRFFGRETARELAERAPADLLIGNNVLAHVPDLNDFVEGLRIALAPHGVVTMEFPHLLRLMVEKQFDTIYHEHFSYFSFSTAQRVFTEHGLTVFDVEELPTHGGSLRVYARHDADTSKPVEQSVVELAAREEEAGLSELAPYLAFAEEVKETKREILAFLIDSKRAGKTIVGYGAPAKGNTFLNYCGIRTDFLEYTVDLSPHKQGRYLPGTHIPIKAPEEIRRTQPDFVLILPWNLKDEIMEQMSYIREWGGQFVARAPDLRVYA